MTDDITFCGSDCNNKKCFRHPSNIREPRIPHSFAYLKDTDDCPLNEKVPVCIHYKVCERREYCNDRDCEDYKENKE